jgi:hypothetical protein
MSRNNRNIIDAFIVVGTSQDIEKMIYKAISLYRDMKHWSLTPAAILLAKGIGRIAVWLRDAQNIDIEASDLVELAAYSELYATGMDTRIPIDYRGAILDYLAKIEALKYEGHHEEIETLLALGMQAIQQVETPRDIDVWLSEQSTAWDTRLAEPTEIPAIQGMDFLLATKAPVGTIVH